MERRQSKLLGRLLGRFRNDPHHRFNIDKRVSRTSASVHEEQAFATSTRHQSLVLPTGSSNSESTGLSTNEGEDQDIMEHPDGFTPKPSSAASESVNIDDEQFLQANIDLRYSGQYLTPEQLPDFCDQLHNLVEVIRNIQSYARITGEYPIELEKRLEQEAREVAALAAETRNARDVVARARLQRRAVRAQKKQLVGHLSTLRETEVHELENTVRLSDRKLYKNWEGVKDSNDPTAFEPILDEIKNKQTALECLVRLVEGRQSSIARSSLTPPSLPPPQSHDSEDSSTPGLGRKGFRRACKRRRKEAVKEPRSVPLSGEPSRHAPQDLSARPDTEWGVPALSPSRPWNFPRVGV